MHKVYIRYAKAYTDMETILNECNGDGPPLKPKTHDGTHYVDSVPLFEVPKLASAGLGENAHIHMLKDPFRASFKLCPEPHVRVFWRRNIMNVS